MRISVDCARWLSTSLALVALAVGPLRASAAELEQARLANGLDLLLKESHGGPMVASIVTVGAGARFEDAQSYGASHFLEHMVFNGTATRTREDINEGIKAYGGYINAFTRREYTCYVLLIPREYLREGLAIQADMLFGSQLPAAEFEKEKRVVIEEMNKDYDSGSYRGELHRNAFLLAGTPYAHPILGSVETIERLRREDVLAYYREHYQPGNCRLFLVGDFERGAAFTLVDSLFGQVPGQAPAPLSPVALPWPAAPALHSYRAEEGSPRLDLVWRIPALSMTAGDAAAHAALAEMLTDEHRSPLRGEGPALELGAGLEYFADFGLLTLTLDVGEQDPAQQLRLLSERLATLGTWVPDHAWTAEVANRLRVDDILLQDTYHYYAMMKSAELHLGGYPFLASYRDAVAALDPAALRGALEGGILAGAPQVLWSAQSADSAATALPGGFSAAAFRVQAGDATLGVDAAAPARPARRAPAAAAGEAGELRLRLDNGLTVLLRSDPSSEVCAAHVLVRGRSACEPPGREGMVTLAHELLLAGTRRHDEASLAAALSGLGARLKLGDDPWIPFDDYYTREDFSFLRLEALDETADAALALLAELLGEASYPEAAVEREKGKLLGSLRMQSPRPSEVARQALGEQLFAGGPRGRSLRGTPASIAAITAEELRSFHPRYFAPERMILSVVSGLPLSTLRRSVETRFGTLPAAPGIPLSPTTVAVGPAELRRPLEKAQVALLAARALPPAAALPEEVEVLVDVLSARLALELREVQGLAYSVGAGLSFVPGLAGGEPGFTLATLQIATGAENREQARRGMQAELERLATAPPSGEEVFRAVNGRWGRELMRDLSRIHQAYRLGLREHLGLAPFVQDTERVARQRTAEPALLAGSARQFLLQDDWIWTLAGGGLQ